VSEYLSRLRRDQLQKFAQYLISELPQQLLPTAQRLLDELLSSQESAINSVSGAPDPTAGPSATDHSKWCLDEGSLRENIKKMLVRFCGPSPLVFSDVNALYLANTAPPTAAEWSNLLRPLRGREPEGMWNLLSIVRELFRRGDLNAVSLLVILTEECLTNDQVLIWWFDSRSQASGNYSSHNLGNRGNTNAASTEATKHACAGFCDELVSLWRLAALNPKLTDEEREEVKVQLQEWHQKAVEKGCTVRGAGLVIPQTAMSCFPGFLPAIEACCLDWKNVNLGIVPEEKVLQVLQPLTLPCARICQPEATKDEESKHDETTPVVSAQDSQDVNDENLSSTSDDVEDDLEVLCARTEALHVHGYRTMAGKLAVKLAENILNNGAKLNRLRSSCGTGNKNKGPGKTSFTSTILVKAAFLCSVLEDDLHLHHLAFRVGMLGLEMPRQPARSKALEVKLANQETDLVTLLKRLPLGPSELAIVREKAELLHQGQLSRGEAVLPIMLATFIFDVLCPRNGGSHNKRQITGKLCETTKEDEELGFKAALYALGMKGNALETQYPMLCEGTRRQRGDLALALLLYCRDDSARIRQIMEVLLDKNRYDLPNVAGEAQNKKKLERSDSQESKSEGSEASNNGAVKSRGTLEVTPRRGSNGQSSSSTSDSGTDSSKDRSKPRAAFSRPQPPRLTASVDDESGSSSGVDTDSVPVSRDHDSPITVRIVEVTSGGLRGSGVTADIPVRSIPHSDEPLSDTSSASVSTHGTLYVDPHQLREPEKETANAPGMTQVFSYVEVPPIAEPLCASLLKQGISNAEMLSSFEPSKEVLSVTECANVPSINTPNDNISQDILELDASKGAITRTDTLAHRGPCIGEPCKDDGQVCGSVDPVFAERVNPNSHLPCVSGVDANAFSLGETSYDNNSTRNPLAEASSSSSVERVSIICYSDGSSGTVQSIVPTSQYLSSEGDVSDIEADFEETQLTSSQCQVSDTPGSSCSMVNRDENNVVCISSVQTSSSLPSAAAAFLGDELADAVASVSISTDEAASARSDALGDHECDEGAAAAVAAAAPLEPPEEQSSESGARGSASTGASADDTDRGRRRNRSRGRRRRRGGKSALYQATEAEAHFMFELAKTVLNKAGGNHTTSVFTQTTSSDTQTGPHRVLQLCAFEIGLFALGLHNRTSPNWLSRTYSSHVSWISGQAMEIGHQAITLLLERWEGNLTPSEVASIADRASRSNDRAMVRAAAELGLSCLHMATTLNPVEIQRALCQCRDEDSQLLDQACQAVESAARGGGVYPEVLFDVAKHWFYLHEKTQTSSSGSRPAKNESRSRGGFGRPSQSTSSSSQSPPLSPFVPQIPQFTIPPPLYTTPEQYVQQQMHQQVHQMMGHYPAYLSSSDSGYRSGSQSHYSYPFSRNLLGTQFSLSGAYAGLAPPPYQTTSVSTSSSQHPSRLTATQQGTQVSFYLNSAYRVGMLALEFLSRRTSDDRPNVKFSRNPSCSDDIRWLCSLSAKLGTSHLQRFCVAALNAVVSPFVLHDLALEAARHMARSNPAQLAVNLRSPTISPLVQKSLTMYAQCIRYNLINISQNEYDEFVELLRHARGAFCMAPGGMTQFNELLQSIRWGHSKKKELWQMIMTGLAKA